MSRTSSEIHHSTLNMRVFGVQKKLSKETTSTIILSLKCVYLNQTKTPHTTPRLAVQYESHVPGTTAFSMQHAMVHAIVVVMVIVLVVVYVLCALQCSI